MAKRESAFFRAMREAQQDADTPPRLNLPVKQQDSIPVSQQDSEPANQHTGMPSKHLDSKPARQHTGKPVSQQDSILVKATFYLTEADIMQLEQIRLARRSRGVRVDKSALIREAIRLLQP